MKINLKAGLITMVFGLFYAVCGYICGHSTAMHQHASTEEQDKMLRDEDGSINQAKYIREAFKDYKRMIDDPLGLNRIDERLLRWTSFKGIYLGSSIQLSVLTIGKESHSGFPFYIFD